MYADLYKHHVLRAHALEWALEWTSRDAHAIEKMTASELQEHIEYAVWLQRASTVAGSGVVPSISARWFLGAPGACGSLLDFHVEHIFTLLNECGCPANCQTLYLRELHETSYMNMRLEVLYALLVCMRRCLTSTSYVPMPAVFDGGAGESAGVSEGVGAGEGDDLGQRIADICFIDIYWIDSLQKRCSFQFLVWSHKMLAHIIGHDHCHDLNRQTCLKIWARFVFRFFHDTKLVAHSMSAWRDNGMYVALMRKVRDLCMDHDAFGLEDDLFVQEYEGLMKLYSCI